MQTNIELATASGRVIGLPVSTRRERLIRAATERPVQQASLFTLVQEVKRAERWETMVWVGLAIAAIALLVLSL